MSVLSSMVVGRAVCMPLRFVLVKQIGSTYHGRRGRKDETTRNVRGRGFQPVLYCVCSLGTIYSLPLYLYAR